jgi:hypothetical protein
MPANRIFTPPGTFTFGDAAGQQMAGGAMPNLVILVVNPMQQAAWQEIYRLAAERARQALARVQNPEPPRHHRLLAVWN